MNDLVKQWKEAARRDDLFNHMVPGDVRQLIGEIERQWAALKLVTTSESHNAAIHLAQMVLSPQKER